MSTNVLQAPRVARLNRPVAMRLAATEYERFADLLAELRPEQWAAPTDCPGWTVRDMAGHVLGMTRMVTTVPEMVRQQVAAGRRARRDGCSSLDALTALQVESNADLGTAELVAEMRRTGVRAARARRRVPALLRGRALPELQDVGDAQEPWTVGYLMDVILTRDPFMHRIDITRATGLAMTVTADHERVIVADVVEEWAERHGQPFVLDLSGPAGGRRERGEAGESIAMDALEFCRTVSGRAPGQGLLSQQVPF